MFDYWVLGGSTIWGGRGLLEQAHSGRYMCVHMCGDHRSILDVVPLVLPNLLFTVFFLIEIFIGCIYICGCVCMCARVCHSVCVEFRGQLMEVCSLLLFLSTM